MSDDWFADAASEANKSDFAKAARSMVKKRLENERKAELEARKIALSKRKDPAFVGAAAREFTGYGTSHKARPKSLPVTPDMGLAAIEQHVRDSKDPFAEAGAWISKITTALSLIAKESLDDPDNPIYPSI